MLEAEDYQVGWISAVRLEYVIARQLLDEEYATPPVPEEDENVYTCGRIGEHYVVVACLSARRHVIASAASTAGIMLRSFPNLHLRLAVGIGGGAPSRENDIRLGDIVVSTPGALDSGVIHYKVGKSVRNRHFVLYDCLDAPQSLVLAATQKLETVYQSQGSPLSHMIEEMIGRNEHLRETYDRPDLTGDVLYKSNFIHSDETLSCEDQCRHHQDCIVTRPKRCDEQRPVLHYGLIASVERQVKDAVARDQTAEERSVLCFEEEAAALLNHLQFLVIRGICDYTDTHKNEAWQGYAAAVAAAYAKDLLGVISPQAVDDVSLAGTWQMIGQSPFSASNGARDGDRKGLDVGIDGESGSTSNPSPTALQDPPFWLVGKTDAQFPEQGLYNDTMQRCRELATVLMSSACLGTQEFVRQHEIRLKLDLAHLPIPAFDTVKADKQYLEWSRAQEPMSSLAFMTRTGAQHSRVTSYVTQVLTDRFVQCPHTLIINISTLPWDETCKSLKVLLQQLASKIMYFRPDVLFGKLAKEPEDGSAYYQRLFKGANADPDCRAFFQIFENMLHALVLQGMTVYIIIDTFDAYVDPRDLLKMLRNTIRRTPFHLVVAGRDLPEARHVFNKTTYEVNLLPEVIWCPLEPYIQSQLTQHLDGKKHLHPMLTQKVLAAARNSLQLAKHCIIMLCGAKDEREFAFWVEEIDEGKHLWLSQLLDRLQTQGPPPSVFHVRYIFQALYRNKIAFTHQLLYEHVQSELKEARKRAGRR